MALSIECHDLNIIKVGAANSYEPINSGWILFGLTF